MENFNKTLETQKENVRNHSMLLRAFIPLIPKKDRTHAYKWLAKLSHTEGCSPFQLKNRAEYLCYFIMNAAQGHGMMPPFIVPPPYGEIPPLCASLPKEVYAEVMDCVDRKGWWKQEQLIEGLDDHELQDADEQWVLHPDFFKNQPVPSSNGSFVYACVFAPKDN